MKALISIEENVPSFSPTLHLEGCLWRVSVINK